MKGGFMVNKLEEYAKLMIFFTVIDIVCLASFPRFGFSFLYVLSLIFLNLISTFVSYLYLKEKESHMYYILLVPLTMPIGMLFILIKKGKNSIRPY